MQPRVSVQELLGELGEDGAERAAAAAGAEQRARVVAAMRRTHVELMHDKRRRVTPRKRALLLVAAVAALSGTALAAHGGIEELGRWLGRDRTAMRLAPATPRSEDAKPRNALAASQAPSSLRNGSEPSTEGTPIPAGSTADDGPTRAIAASSAAARRLESGSARQASAASRESEPRAAADEDRELAAVNELFAEAKRARREHRDADALAACQKLLAKFPHSVLAQEAAVERFRALARLGRSAEARHFATRYLASYPNGFAAAEARALTTAPSETAIHGDFAPLPP